MCALMSFDGDCGFRTASVNVIRRWVRPDADNEPWQRTDIARFDLTEDDCTPLCSSSTRRVR